MAPDKFDSLNCHWYANGDMPSALTVKVTLLPTMLVWLCGWLVMTGGVGRVSENGCRPARFDGGIRKSPSISVRMMDRPVLLPAARACS